MRPPPFSHEGMHAAHEVNGPRFARVILTIIHIDETRAVEPQRTSIWDKDELPETYPFNV